MNVRELHNEAMDIADTALELEAAGNKEQALQHFKQAYQYELEAAKRVLKLDNNEPTRSILLRSAISLAMSAGLNDEALHLVHLALAGTPPYEIKEELYAFLDQLTYKQHLAIKGVNISHTDVQVSLSGQAVGYGMVKFTEVDNRTAAFTKIVTRTAERLNYRKFRTTGNPTKGAHIQPYISAIRPQSFAFTLRFGLPDTPQATIPEFEKAPVVHEVLECLSLLQNQQMEELKARIPDEDYRKNFIALSKELAPDGKDISTVGFTYKQGNQFKELPFRITKRQIGKILSSPKKDSNDEQVTVEGKLSVADSEKGQIKLVSIDNKSTFNIKISKSMDDIVKIHWAEIVSVVIKRKLTENFYRLLDIQNIEEV